MARVPAGLVTAVLQFVAGAGGDAVRARSAAGLRAGDLVDPDRRLDSDQLAAVLASAAQDLDEPDFGLRVGRGFDLDAFGLLSYAVLNASTVGIGVTNLARFFGSVVEGAQARLSTRGNESRLRISVDGIDRSTNRHLQECGVLVVVRMIGRLIGDSSWRPTGVSLAHPAPRSVAAHTDSFGVAPKFGTRSNEIRFEASVMKREVRDADRSLLPDVDERLQDIVGREPDEESWLSALRIQVASRLCDGHPTLRTIAPELGLTARTLQRRLAMQGLTYRDLVQDARKRLAARYLEESETDLTEVAFLLGYSELSAFSHAFHRWTGTSPGAVRRRSRVGR
jgi:AraC-like DNA-binding protein